MFSECAQLSTITLSNSLTSIRDDAFGGSGLTSIVLPNSITSLGEYVFRDCTQLSTITLSNSITSIAYKAFYACSRLSSILIPDSAIVHNDAFGKCDILEAKASRFKMSVKDYCVRVRVPITKPNIILLWMPFIRII